MIIDTLPVTPHATGHCESGMSQAPTALISKSPNIGESACRVRSLSNRCELKSDDTGGGEQHVQAGRLPQCPNASFTDIWCWVERYL